MPEAQRSRGVHRPRYLAQPDPLLPYGLRVFVEPNQRAYKAGAFWPLRLGCSGRRSTVRVWWQGAVMQNALSFPS